MAKSLKDTGREILRERKRNLKNDATLHGVRPKKGLWLVSPGRGMVYGQIARVKIDGTIVWTPADGHPMTRVETRPHSLINGDYAYVPYARKEVRK